MLKNKGEIANPTTYREVKTVAATTANLKIYGNNLGVIQRGVNAGILSLSKKPDPTPYLANIYSTTANLLLLVEVPQSLAETHLQLINGFRKYSEGLHMLTQQNNDPAKALLGLTKTKDAASEIVTSFEKIRKTIILNKIEYTADEPGLEIIAPQEIEAGILLE